MSLGARSISHLEEISEEGIKMMASSSSVAVVLPTTAYILKLCPPPVRKMIDEGVLLLYIILRIYVLGYYICMYNI